MKTVTAISDAEGTVLPRPGFFHGVRAPQYQAVISATEPGGDELQQTTSLSLPRYGLFSGSLPQTGHSGIRTDDFAHVVLMAWSSTDSPGQSFRLLMPLRPVAEATERLPDARSAHAGLTAVSRLVDMLGLRRPTVLKMGGVPSSTFYFWQKNPHAVIRTPTISRLLRLQAQIAILDEALGRERMRAWVFSPSHFEKLQGDDTIFAQALAEAADALAEATQVRPQRRLRRSDYTANLDRNDFPA